MIRLVQNSFFGGQLDFEMMGRQDYQRYAKGATVLKNFNIMKRGGLDKRRGFDRIFELTTLPGVTEDTRFRMIPFAYKKTQGFVLCMSGAKCIVIATNPVTQYKVYNVTDLDGVYSNQEIQELDYQQCGDVIFIAHQNHPPARVVHDIGSDGEDGFHYENLELNQQNSGIPSITGATSSRLPVTYKDTDPKPPLYTEKYKVSAVFDGIETYPCTEFYSENSSPWGAATWSGTNYPMPWTESHKISLRINPVTRTGKDGLVQYPEEIRVYKKAYNYFGLIGVIKISANSTVKALSHNSGQYVVVENSDGTSENKMFDVSDDPVEHGVDVIGWKIAENGQITLNVSSISSGYVKLSLGACHYEIAQDENLVTFYYDGWDATSIHVKAHNIDNWSRETVQFEGDVSLPSSVKSRSFVCEKQDGESAQSFDTRWRSEYQDFCSGITDVAFVNLPFTSGGSNRITIYPTGGGVTVSNMRSYQYTSIGQQVFDDNYITPDTSITPPERSDEDVFGGAGNYPASVSLSQQRLIWASSKNDPARVWMSQVGDFYTYSNHEIQVADDPIDFTLPVTRFAKINHICEMRKLLMFNSACEWLVDSASSVQGLTYETIQAYPQSYSGSSERLKPIICNNSLIFCERTGQAVRRFAYDISNDGFAGRDVSILSSSIFENNSIVDWTYQQFPYSTLWCVMANGNISSFEFMEEQDIMAWMTHELGGGGKAVCVATSYAVAPAMDEVSDTDAYAYATHEEVFACVKRQGSLWIERMRVRSRPPVSNGVPSVDSIYHSLCMDGVRVLNSENGYQPTEEEGAVWIPNDTTTGETISREDAIAKIGEGVDVYEGFPFDAEYVSVFPNINNGQIGNGQFDIKHVQGCGLRLMNSFGGKVKPVGADSYEPIQYFYNDPQNDHRPVFADGNLSLYNHDTNIMPLVGVNNRDGRVSVRQSDPYPFSVLSYEIDFEPESGGFRG